MRNISGEFYQSLDVNGSLHWSFYPNKLDSMAECFKMDIELAHMLTQAHRLLGVLEGTVRNLPDIEPFLYLIFYNEARNSCAFDGIRADLESTMIFSKQTDEGIMVKNCCDVLRKLKKLPVSVNVLCEIHKDIMKSETTTSNGEIRKKILLMHPQYVTNMEEYNPPPPDQVLELMEDLRQFICMDHSIDVLVKTAMAYYQFETIHPFENGNGRVGRILILLILMQDGILSYPALSMSAYLLEEKDECYSQFISIQHFGNFSGWLRFFIKGIVVSAQNAICQIEEAKKLRKSEIKKICSFGHKSDILKCLYDYIEKNPIVSINVVSEDLGVAYNTVAKYIWMLCRLGILMENNKRSRYRLFTYNKLMCIFQLENE